MHFGGMTLDAAIEQHRIQLTRIIATLFAMVGLVEGGTIKRMSPRIYRKVLRLLRPAESAVRRLIVIAARSITLQPPRQGSVSRKSATTCKARTRITFKLFDPRPRFSSAFAGERPRRHIIVMPVNRVEPRIRVIGFDPRLPLLRQSPRIVPEPPPPPLADGTVSASRLCRRLAAIKAALHDLPRQARRYARWQSKPQDKRRPQFASALRPGTPPGHRKNPIYKVDEILAECDFLARHPPQPG